MNISKLKELMRKNKITQKELAEIADVTRPTIGNLLNSGDFRVTQIEKIADYLQVPVSYFFDTPGINIQNVGNGNAGNINILNSENERLKDKVEGLEREIELLREMNDLLKNK